MRMQDFRKIEQMQLGATLRSIYISNVLRTAIALTCLLSVNIANPLAAQESDDTRHCRSEPLGAIEFSPAAGARDVPVNSPVRVLYSKMFWESYAGDVNALVSLIALETMTPIAGVVERVGDEAVLIPSAALQPGSGYRAQMLDDGRSGPISFDFHVINKVDRQPPRAGSIVSLDSDAAVACDDPDQDGFRIDVKFEPGSDDGAIGSLEYHVYLVGGPKLDAPRRVSRFRRFTTGAVTSSFFLPAEQADGAICVEVHVADGLGRIDDDVTPECFDPRTGVFFDGLCSAAGWSGSAWSTMFLIGFALFFRRRRA